MKALLIGDVVGKGGCAYLTQHLRTLKRLYGIDLTIVNGENSAVGNGVTNATMQSLFDAGADVITTGNHCFARREHLSVYDNSFLLRPLNYPEGCIGHGFCLVDFGRTTIAVVNLAGTTYMDALDNPFTVIDRLLPQLPTPNIFIDFHAEATAEKKAMGYFLAGRVTAVIGTHTHVQTADETILSAHTAYLTDVGMTGPEESVLGVEIAPAIERMRFRCAQRFTHAVTPSFLNGVIVTFDEKNGKAREIERIITR